MSELGDICREAASLREHGTPFLLATVVRVAGSSYRRPGARMLIAEDEWLAGSVSGGCLERDVLMRGAFRVRTGAPVIVRYDSTSDDEAGWGLGLGCNGIVDVLIERIDTRTELDPTAFVEASYVSEETSVLITVISSSDPRISVGARVGAREKRGCVGTVREPVLRAVLEEEARESLHEKSLRARVIDLEGVTVLVERFAPPPHLFVLGSRHDAAPLVSIASATGLDVTLADGSTASAVHGRFYGASRIVAATGEELVQLVSERARAAAVIMTHDYGRDREYLAALLNTRAKYIGVLGPRARTARMVDELGLDCHATFERIYSPVGLDLGGETPREIALAIVAEVHSVLGGASSQSLRERQALRDAMSAQEWAAA